MKPDSNLEFRATRSVALALFLAVLTGATGCTAMYPQTAAQNYAPLYYEGGYNSLTPQQKMHLEDHLSQSEQPGVAHDRASSRRPRPSDARHLHAPHRAPRTSDRASFLAESRHLN